MIEKLVESTTGVKFIAFLLILLAAVCKMHDDVQFALLVGGAYGILVTGNVLVGRKALDTGAKTE